MVEIPDDGDLQEEYLPDDEQIVEMLRLSFAYHAKLSELEVEFQVHEGSDPTILRRLHEEMGQIRPCQRWCVRHLEDDIRAAIMCSKFAGVGGNLLDQVLSRLELIQWREAGLAGARRAALVEDQAGHLIYLSYVHFVNDNATVALEMLGEALALESLQSDRAGYAAALQHQGMFYAQLERVDEAIEALNKALALYDDLDDEDAKAKCFSALAVCHSKLQESQKAVDLYIQAIEIVGEGLALGTYLSNMSGELMNLKRHAEAWYCLSRAEKIAVAWEDPTLKGLVSAQLGRWYGVQADAQLRTRALPCYEDAVEHFRLKGERYHELRVLQTLEFLYRQVLDNASQPLSYDQQSMALRRLIQILFDLEKHEDNLQVCRRLLDIAEANQDLSDQLEAAVSLGHAALQLREYEQSIQAHSKGIAILSQIRERDGQTINLKAEGELLLSMGQAYRHSDRPNEAIRNYEGAHRIAEILPDSEMKHRALGNLGLLYADRGSSIAAIDALNKTFAYYEGINDYRLMGHAQFNLAYAHYRSGDVEEATTQGKKALDFLLMINDAHVEAVKAQIESWSRSELPE